MFQVSEKAQENIKNFLKASNRESAVRVLLSQGG